MSKPARKYTFNNNYQAKGIRNEVDNKKVDNRGNWPYSFFQRSINNEQQIKVQSYTSNFDHSKIPYLMSSELSPIEILVNKYHNATQNNEKLSKSDKLRVENYLNKQQKKIEEDFKLLEKSQLNANVETVEGKIRKLFLVCDKYIENNDNDMIFYVYQKLNEYIIPTMYNDKLDKIKNIISKLDVIKLQFVKYHGSMPPLNENGFKSLDLWQKDVIKKIDDKKSVIVQAPTSAGKSIITGYLYLNANIKVLVVVPTDILAWQTSSMIGKIMNKDIPIITNTYETSIYREELIKRINTSGIVVGTPKQLLDYLPFINIQFDWVVIDEIHMIGKDNCSDMENILKIYNNIPTLVLSATIGNVEYLQEWFNKIGTNMELVKCDKRFFNFQHFYYNNGFIRIHPLSMINIEEFENGEILTKTINSTPPDIWDLYIKLSKYFDLGDLDIYKYFDRNIRITLNDAYNYNKKLIEFMVIKTKTNRDDIYKILNIYSENYINNNINYVNLALDLKNNNKTPALIFKINSYECLELVNDFSKKVKYMENEKYPNLIKERLKENDKYIMKEKQKEKLVINGKKLSDMGEKRLCKEILKGTFDNKDEEEVYEINIYEPHPDFIFNKNQYFTKEYIKDIATNMKIYFPPNGDEYHYIIDLLWRGVGVYVKGLPEPYLRLIQNLACSSKLAIVFSDETLVFGVSMPFRTTVITNDPNVDCMLYHQMAGRAGRRGLDKEGNIIFVNNSWDRIKELSTNKIPNIIGCDTTIFGYFIGEKISNNNKWEQVKYNYLNEEINNTVNEYYLTIDKNREKLWDFVNVDDINLLNLMWRFRKDKLCIIVPFLITYIRKIYCKCSFKDENIQIDFANFILPFLEEGDIECNNIHINKYKLFDHLDKLELSVSRKIDSNISRSIRENRIIVNNNTIYRDKILNFGEKLRIIQHYFYYSKEENIAKMIAKLLTRIWWMYHSSSPLMK
jgi:hypothetical protein